MGPRQPEGDWGFRAEDPGGALGGYVAHWCFWWDDECQDRFSGLWGRDADEVADDIADRYGFGWPWLAPRVLPTRAPTTQALIESFLAEDWLVARTNGTNPRTVLDVSTVWGSFHVVRTRRSWFVPSATACAVCDREFWTGELPVWTYMQFGIGRYCQACCQRARDGRRRRWSGDEAVAALRELATSFGGIPTQAYGFEVLPPNAPPEDRDRWMRALCNMPDPVTLKQVVGVRDWFGALQVAGLVDDGRRTSRGTWCRAEDGHLCRSLLEKSIDDWMSRRGLPHDREPRWPVHLTLNPHRLKRADWLLPSGAYVECVGMMEDPHYAEKITLKQRLAEDLGVKLYLVWPSDIYSLEGIFAEEVSSIGDI